jgi:hypothetical protein
MVIPKEQFNPLAAEDEIQNIADVVPSRLNGQAGTRLIPLYRCRKLKSEAAYSIISTIRTTPLVAPSH